MESSLVRNQEDPSSVAGYVQSCLISLELCLQKAAKIHPRELSMVEDQFARFSVWKDSIGVFSEGRGSLDHRLREARDVREIITTLSETFNYRLQECARIFDSLQAPELVGGSLPPVDEEFGNSIREIKDEISLFHRFSNTIRRATKDAQKQKAEKLFKIRDEHEDDVEPFLTDQFDHYIRDRFPDIAENIRKRLAKTMVIRRNGYYIAEFDMERNRKDSLCCHQSPLCRDPSPRLSSNPPCRYPKWKQAKNLPRAPRSNLPKTMNAPTVVQSAVQTATTLTPAAFQRASTPSVVSKSQSSALGGTQELQFPPSPCEGLIRSYERLSKQHKHQIIAHLESDQPRASHMVTTGAAHRLRAWDSGHRKKIRGLGRFLEAFGEICCPFCFHFLPAIEAADEKKWKYVSPELLDLSCDGAARKRWGVSSHDPFIADTRTEYLRHMKAAHSGKFSDLQHEIMAERNSLAMDPIFKSCPLCGAEDVGANLEGHIVGHMRLLALKSLPAYEQDAQVLCEPENKATASLALSGQQSRSTVQKELESDVPPLFFDDDPWMAMGAQHQEVIAYMQATIARSQETIAKLDAIVKKHPQINIDKHAAFFNPDRAAEHLLDIRRAHLRLEAAQN
ncbi:serine/threonine protein phosphatase [Colletotrichum sojae]|uniref:Serine/threonine protein phosphatase n=1 Tax=Colletotrichum sojae TaxID=2175907 RepID=A0A8H6MQF5_9PEZI|nr:serine/threonine protein phosphatase [Colletotrichum sojae]